METLNYIFSSLHETEDAIGRVVKCLKRQNRINKNFAVFTLVVAANAVVTGLYIQEQDKKIAKLSKEIEELKESKGE